MAYFNLMNKYIPLAHFNLSRKRCYRKVPSGRACQISLAVTFKLDCSLTKSITGAELRGFYSILYAQVSVSNSVTLAYLRRFLTGWLRYGTFMPDACVPINAITNNAKGIQNGEKRDRYVP